MFEKLKALREERENGFTLIELLVVILIIGILAAVAIPVFMNQRKAAIDSSVESDVKNASTAVETWAASQRTAGAAIDLADLRSRYGLKTSEGVTLSVTGTNTDGYCIVAFSESGANYVNAGQAATYDSKAGGLNRDGGACAGGISNEDGSGSDYEAVSGFSISNGANTSEFTASAAWNMNGAPTVYLNANDSSINGSFEGIIHYYCGTTEVATANMWAQNFSNGTLSQDQYGMPALSCQVDGMTLSTTGGSEWKIAGQTPVISIAGTAPNTNTNGGSNAGGDEPPPPIQSPEEPPVYNDGSGSGEGTYSGGEDNGDGHINY